MDRLLFYNTDGHDDGQPVVVTRRFHGDTKVGNPMRNVASTHV
ncbi:hypothetical protein [Aeoliella straminimaris]|nr:hypothetical protein [Aeoliella straminimaris]